MSSKAKKAEKRYPITRRSLYWLASRTIVVTFALICGISFSLILIIGAIKGTLAPVGTLFVIGAIYLGFWFFLADALISMNHRPPYRWLAKRGILFDKDMQGKYLTNWKDDHYYFQDDRWFVVVVNGGASVLYADKIDFSIPIKIWVTQGGRFRTSSFYQFTTTDDGYITAQLDRTIKPFRQWVEAHGGRIGP